MNNSKTLLTRLICFLMLSCGAVVHGADMGAGVGKSKIAFSMKFPDTPRRFSSVDRCNTYFACKHVEDIARGFEQQQNPARCLPVPTDVFPQVYYRGLKDLCNKDGKDWTVAGLRAIQKLGGADAYNNVGQNIHDVALYVQHEQDSVSAAFERSACLTGSKETFVPDVVGVLPKNLASYIQAHPQAKTDLKSEASHQKN